MIKEAVKIDGDKIEIYPQRMEDDKLYPIFYRGKNYYLCKRMTALDLYEEESLLEKIVRKLTKGRLSTRRR